MIAIVSFALSQRFMVLVGHARAGESGASSRSGICRSTPIPISRRRTSRSSPNGPGHAAEEVERLITIPLEDRDERHPEARRAALDLALRPVVGRDEFRLRHRSVLRARAGLRAHAERRVPDGVTPGMSPLFSPSGLIYRYVLQSPDRSPQDLKITRGLGPRAHVTAPSRASPTIRASAAPTMQYQVLLDPNKLFVLRRHRPAGRPAAGRQQRQRRRRLLFAGRPVLLHPRPRPGARPSRTSATSSSPTNNGIPVYVKDVAKVDDRPRAAARPVRLHEAGRRGRRRHPDARRRAGAGGAQASRGR